MWRPGSNPKVFVEKILDFKYEMVHEANDHNLVHGVLSSLGRRFYFMTKIGIR